MRSIAVACSNSDPDTSDAGFATPAAAVVSLALAMVATAVTAGGVMQLRLARADMARAEVESVLDGAQQRAALAMLSGGSATRLRWTLADGGGVQMLAESEAAKLNLAAATVLNDATLSKLGVTDAAALRARLVAVSATAPSADIEAADPAPLWRVCGRSLISRLGTATRQPTLTAQVPKGGPVAWRIAEVWRLRATSVDGWVDDRLVRFTGDPARPAAVVERRLYRTSGGGDRCDAILSAN
jgi:hypothetical protein